MAMEWLAPACTRPTKKKSRQCPKAVAAGAPDFDPCLGNHLSFGLAFLVVVPSLV
jgi:hypothetical protein